MPDPERMWNVLQSLRLMHRPAPNGAACRQCLVPDGCTMCATARAIAQILPPGIREVE